MQGSQGGSTLETFSHVFYKVIMFLSVSDSSLSASICQNIQTFYFRTSKNTISWFKINQSINYHIFMHDTMLIYIINLSHFHAWYDAHSWLYDIYAYSLFLLLMYYLSIFWTTHPSLFMCACLRKHNFCRLSVDDSNYVRNVSVIFYIVLNNFIVGKTIGSIVLFYKLF